MATTHKPIIWIKRNVLEHMVDDLTTWYPKETGGVLMGYWNQKQVAITNIINGGPKAVRTQVSFVPDHDYQIEEITKIYNASGRTETYLGDWHTHPNSNSYMSAWDKKTLKKIGKFKEARLSRPIMMIIGTSPAEVKVWLYDQRKIFISDGLLEAQLKIYE